MTTNTTAPTESWRDCILRTIREEGVCPWDELHVACNGDEDELAEIEEAVKALEAEHLVVDVGGVLQAVPA